MGLGTGTLYLCATPIGNLEDTTLRVLRILKEVSLIAAEDTRHTRKLLSHYGIHTPLSSYHRHNENGKSLYLLDVLREGRDIALVSDAGMPGISDPGYHLITEAIKNGIRVVPLPGASAVLTALVVSGLPTERFAFEGFLPRNRKARRQKLAELACDMRTLIFFEAPHRVLSTLQDLEAAFGPRLTAVVREATKAHEEVIRGEPAVLLSRFNEVPPKGEITIVVQGAPSGKQTGQEDSFTGPERLLEEVEKLTAGGADARDAIKEIARRLDLPKRQVYAAVVAQKAKRGIKPPSDG